MGLKSNIFIVQTYSLAQAPFDSYSLSGKFVAVAIAFSRMYCFYSCILIVQQAENHFFFLNHTRYISVKDLSPTTLPMIYGICLQMFEPKVLHWPGSKKLVQMSNEGLRSDLMS